MKTQTKTMLVIGGAAALIWILGKKKDEKAIEEASTIGGGGFGGGFMGGIIQQLAPAPAVATFQCPKHPDPNKTYICSGTKIIGESIKSGGPSFLKDILGPSSGEVKGTSGTGGTDGSLGKSVSNTGSGGGTTYSTITIRGKVVKYDPAKYTSSSLSTLKTAYETGMFKKQPVPDMLPFAGLEKNGCNTLTLSDLSKY